MKTKTEKSTMIPFDKKRANLVMKLHGLKIKTILVWESNGEMPKRYFEKKNIFSIDEKSILELRVAKGLSQIQFVEQFNKMFSINLTTVSLSTWENGHSTPRKYYQNMLAKFYESEKTAGI